MAALALPAEFTEVHVVLDMAGRALARELHLGGRLPMAVGALQPRVPAAQTEARDALVIEFPDVPAVGRMTAVAFPAEAAGVLVHPLVAAVTVLRRALVGRSQMALLAGDGHVLADELKVGEVVIEAHGDAPTLGNMATVALHSELPRVHVGAAMTADAIVTQLLSGDICGMAGVAIDLRVGAEQLEMPVGGVIETGLLPALAVMAARTLRAEPARVRILCLVATVAILGHRVLHASARMAARTIGACVFALEGKAGFACVVEFLRCPLHGGVTLAAVGAA